MIPVRKVVAATLAGVLVVASVQTASARHNRKHAYRQARSHVVADTPIVEGSPVGVTLGLVGTGIPGATTAAPYPPGYGFYGPGYGFYGPGYGSPGY